MPGDPNGYETLRHYCDDAMLARIDYVSAQEEEVPLQRGVLFLMAFWSVPAVLGFKNVCWVFAQVGVPVDFVFRVLDIDGASRSLATTLSRFPVRIGGNAEAYWYRDGKILAATNVATATEERIRELLAEIARE